MINDPSWLDRREVDVGATGGYLTDDLALAAAEVSALPATFWRATKAR